MVKPHRSFTSIHAFVIALLMHVICSPVAIAADTDSEQGKAIYLQHCASCHGVDGEGNGPLAAVLTTPPANLRLLYQRYGNPLPAEKIASFIDGRNDVKAHGPRDMPVWGERLYGDGKTGEHELNRQIARLVAFLQSIQGGSHTARR